MPLDRGHIEQQLHAIGEGPHWWDVRELRDLPNVLHHDETILALARGRRSRVRRAWLIVVTDQRVLLLRSFAGAGWRHLEVPAAQIERASLRIGPFRGRVIIVAASGKHRLLVKRPDAYRLHSALAQLAAARTAIPVVGRMHLMRRMFDHVLALPAAAFAPPGTVPVIHAQQLPPPQPDPQVDQRISMLEEQVQELQKQVDFLEDLLRKRHAG